MSRLRIFYSILVILFSLRNKVIVNILDNFLTSLYHFLNSYKQSDLEMSHYYLKQMFLSIEKIKNFIGE